MLQGGNIPNRRECDPSQISTSRPWIITRAKGLDHPKPLLINYSEGKGPRRGLCDYKVERFRCDTGTVPLVAIREE